MNKSDIKDEITKVNGILCEDVDDYAGPIIVGTAAAAVGGTLYICHRLKVKEMKQIRATLKGLEERYAANDKSFIRFNDLDRGAITKTSGGASVFSIGSAGFSRSDAEYKNSVYTYSTKKRKNVITLVKQSTGRGLDSSYSMSIQINDPSLRKYSEYYEAMIQLSFGSLSPEAKRWVKAYMKDFKK